ncbi:hypothetical protein H8N03_22090 [Ramlibacter sp. USB13]|uniref:Uncharacterized protein n=1 Tax=Ramlibacter cellulosilyticus TaxID=2764187 RepID=A0A923MUS4_9BURK|nr:hypothetical protein [Ramlibacter cellulosilyticus]MBC5785648.1 hypothetical protein [Ramlibacter cellulosilyticus]
MRNDPTSWRWLPGRRVPGHGVASGGAADSPYPAGTIALQAPFFRARGVDLSPYFQGTLNVDLAPHLPPAVRPVFDGRLRWFGELEERFLLMPVALRHAGIVHEGLWYYPHPETKPAHFQRPTVVELLLPFIPDLALQAQVEVGFPGAG